MSIINNNKTDPNKILPIRYPWTYELYKKALANTWLPAEIPMQDDIEVWKGYGLSGEERKIILWNLGFFSTAESLTANNIVLSVYNHITDPGARQYLLRQAFEEAVHTDTFIYISDSLGLDPDQIYNMYQTIPSISAKDEFVVSLTKNLLDKDFSTDTIEGIQGLLRDIICFYLIMEGIFFYAGFAMMLAMKRKNKMCGLGQQFEYILRDENLHVEFGVQLINTIKQENSIVWTEKFKTEINNLILRAVELEKDYIYDTCPNGMVGLKPEQFCKYIEYIADRRLEQIGLDRYFKTKSPFPWMSQSVDLMKEKNFFETKVTEYQHGSVLVW